MLLVAVVRTDRSRKKETVTSVRESLNLLIKPLVDTNASIKQSFERQLPLSDDCVLALLELRLFRNLVNSNRLSGVAHDEGFATVLRSYSDTVAKMEQHLTELGKEDFDHSVANVRREAKKQLKGVKRTRSLLEAHAEMNRVVSTIADLMKLMSRRDRAKLACWLQDVSLTDISTLLKAWWRNLVQLGLFAYSRYMYCIKAKEAVAMAFHACLKDCDTSQILVFSRLTENDLVNDAICHTIRFRIGLALKFINTGIQALIAKLESIGNSSDVDQLTIILKEMEANTEATTFLALDAAAGAGNVVAARREARVCLLHFKNSVEKMIATRDYLDKLNL